MLSKVVKFLVILILFMPSAIASSFEVHFLDVGQGDAAVLCCDGEYAIIDGGSANQSSFVYSYLKNNLNIKHLKYVFASHPHEDHIGGLSAALNACSAGRIFSPVASYESDAFKSFSKYADAQGVFIEIPNDGDVFHLGSAIIKVLSRGIDSGSENDLSLILQVTHNDLSFLFTGDAGAASESALVQDKIDIASQVLKIPHHGAEGSSSREFIAAVDPEIAIISVGSNNQYDHPSDWVVSDLCLSSCKIYRTDLHGTIIIKDNGDSLLIEPEKDRPFVSNVEASSFYVPITGESFYIGNKNTMKFHQSTCNSVQDMSDKNKIEFFERATAINAGYVPCKRCTP